MLFQLFKKTPSISAKELQSRLSKEITLLDVRTPSEYRAGHIHKRLMSHLTKFPPTTNPLTKSM
jgi:rhodanese-related sulfurtransferase